MRSVGIYLILAVIFAVACTFAINHGYNMALRDVARAGCAR